MSKLIETLREHFAQTPSKTVWEDIVETLDTWRQTEPETLVEIALPYCAEHLSQWPLKHNIKPQPKHWLEAIKRGDSSILPLLEIAAITPRKPQPSYYLISFGTASYEGQNASFDGTVQQAFYRTSQRNHILAKLYEIELQAHQHRQGRFLRYFPGADFMNECYYTRDVVSVLYSGQRSLGLPLVPEVELSQHVISPHTFTIRPKTLFGFTRPTDIHMEILQDGTLIDTVPLNKVRTHKALRSFNNDLLSARDWNTATRLSFDTLKRELPTIHLPNPLPDGDTETYRASNSYSYQDHRKFSRRQIQQHKQRDAAIAKRPKRDERHRKTRERMKTT